MKNTLTENNLSKFTVFKNNIIEFLSKFNISLDVDLMLRGIDLSDKSYEEVLDNFLLKYSDKYRIFTALYNKEYPYDLELNKKINIPLEILYTVESEKFYGIKFKKIQNKAIVDIVTTNNILLKGFVVDIKYGLEYFINFLNRSKLEIDVKYYSDNISNIFVVINQQTSPFINKIVLYEIYKKIKGHKEITHLAVYTQDIKITVLNNKLVENFYSSFNLSDISYCIREYLDRNGFLVHFSTFCIDCISYILYLQNKRSTNYLRDFLNFRFTGFVLNNGMEVTRSDDNNILVIIDNLKYTVRYPSTDILNRLKYLNKEVILQYYTNITVSYYKCKNINSQLCLINYSDYDMVLSNIYVTGSKKIQYLEDKTPSEIFEYKDLRMHILYSKATHTLLIKFKENINRDLFYMYLISICKFNYMLIQ